MDIDDEIAQLYRLPLDEFTPARNALAKRVNRPTIKDLQKPNVAAWAVNQLHWRHRPVFDRLVKAAERLRAEHRKLLAGKPADIREAEQSHRDTIREAAETIKRVLAEGGQAVSPATMTAVNETLEALPSADSPGTLTRPLRPGGFEALSGLPARSAPAPPKFRLVEKRTVLSPRDAAKEKQREKELEKQREKEERERQRELEKEKREAQAELARTEAAVERIKGAVEKAEGALDKLRAELTEATKAHQRARLRARG